MNIKPGEKIALVGESGSGKTTLVKLLMNFYEFEKGEIMFGDYNIKDINIGSLRDKIAYISQDIFLFSGTIRENLMLGNEDATLDEIIEACKLSKANEFIEKCRSDMKPYWKKTEQTCQADKSKDLLLPELF